MQDDEPVVMKRKTKLAIASICVMAIWSGALWAQLVEQVRFIERPERQAVPHAFPAKTDDPPGIDGTLDDACWQNATRIESFVHHQTRMPAVEPMTGYVAYDEQNLYIGIDAIEGQIDTLAGRPQGDRRDVWNGDEFEVFISPVRDGKTYYQFTVGSKFGQRLDGKGIVGAAYNTDWDSAVTLDKEKGRAYLELRIPAKAVEADAIRPNSLWGFNFARQNTQSEPPDPKWPKNPRAGKESSMELTQWSPTGDTFHNVNRFGLLFFGEPEAFRQIRTPLYTELGLDREEYDNLDLDAQGIVLVRTGGRPLAGLRVSLRLLQGDRVVTEQALPPLETGFVAFLLPVARLPAGDYTLVATLTGGSDATEAMSKWEFRRVDQGLAEGVTTRGRIPLKIPERDFLPNTPWPIRTGVPFPKGALTDPSQVRLLADGKEVPCQASVRARWAPRGSIRWLGLTFVAEFKDGKCPKYELAYGEKREAKPASPVSVQETEADIGITNGCLRFVVAKTGYSGVHRVWLDRDGDEQFGDDELVIAGSSETSPYVVDKDGVVYQAARDRDVVIEVEESGPVHAVIRASGWLEASSGKKLCKHTTYYEVFAGLPHVFVNHTVVITYDTRTNRLKDVAFPVGAQGEGATFGVLGLRGVPCARRGRSFLVQERWDRARTGEWKLLRAAKSAGWCGVGTRTLGVDLIAEHVRERFPKGFSVDEMFLTYHLWPPDLGDTFTDEEELDRKNIYKQFYAHEGPELDFQLPAKYVERLREFAQKEGFYWVYVKQGTRANGQGVALNERFALSFYSDPGSRIPPSDLARLFERDPHAIADPEWIATTNVFGPMVGVDRKGYPQLEKFMGRSLLSMAHWGLKMNDEYGVWNFGDVHTYWRIHLNYAGLHRVWLSHHYGQTEVPWLLYAHYGEPAYLEWARLNNHHTMNVNIVHYHDPQNPLPHHKTGAVYHVKGFVPWGGDTGFAAHLAYVSYLKWGWLLTGNRRARDVAHEWQEGVIAESPPGGQGRDAETFLGEAAEYYQNDWDPRMLELMNRYARSFLSQPPSKQHAAFWNPATFPRYHSLTKSKLAWERLNDRDFRTCGEAYHLTAYAYLVSGDSKYLDEMRNLYLKIRQQYENSESPYDGMATTYWIWQMNQLSQMLVMQAALKKAGLKIVRDAKAPGPPIITGLNPRGRGGPFTMGVRKRAGQTVAMSPRADDKGYENLKITAPDGKPITPVTATVEGEERLAIPGDAPAGVYAIETKDTPAAFQGEVESFFLLRKGLSYTLGEGSQYRLRPLEDTTLISLTVRARKLPAQFILYDPAGKEVAKASSMWGEGKALSVPSEGGPYTLLVTRLGYAVSGVDLAAERP